MGKTLYTEIHFIKKIRDNYIIETEEGEK